MMMEPIQMFDKLLKQVSEEIHTTEDISRLTALFSVRDYLKEKLNAAFDEAEGSQELAEEELSHHQRFNRWLNQHRGLKRPADESEVGE